MSVVIVLLVLSVLIAGGFLIAFLISVHRGQYDDLVTPSVRVLCDDLESEESSDEASRNVER